MAISAIFSAYTLEKERSQVQIPIPVDEALKIMYSNEEANDFISEHLANESNRITKVNLKWMSVIDNYVWDIELMEKECGCKVGSTEALSVLRAQIDPITGEVLSVTTSTGVEEGNMSHGTEDAPMLDSHEEV